jgi:hypothetical protein
MKMTKLYLYAKLIHRILVVVITFLTILMAGTGTAIKYSEFFSSFPFINITFSRYMHNQLSIIFTIVLVCMATTGIIMYLFPIFRKRKA